MSEINGREPVVGGKKAGDYSWYVKVSLYCHETKQESALITVARFAVKKWAKDYAEDLARRAWGENWQWCSDAQIVHPDSRSGAVVDILISRYE